MINFISYLYLIFSQTLRRPKQHRTQAPVVPDLAQTVKPWSDLFKIFRNVFAGAKNLKSISIYVKSCF